MLLFMDGQAHYDTAGIAQKYSSVESSYVAWSVTAEGRFGNSIKRVSSNNNASPLGHLGIAPLMTRSGVWTPTVSGVCGFALRVDDISRVGSSDPAALGGGVLVVVEGSNWHLAAQLNLDGTFSLWRNRVSTAELLAQSAEGVGSGSWIFLEFKWVIDLTAGSFTIRANGVPILTYSGPTKAGPDFISTIGVWNAVHILGVQSQPTAGALLWLTLRMCDLYLADLTGGTGEVKDFLGDGTIRTIFPNGAGLATGWTPSSGLPNWDQVNDKPVPDGDTTYVSASAPGTRDVHQFEDIPGSAVVLGVHYNMLARKEDEGTVTVKPIVGQGSTQYDGPTQGVASVAYDRYLTQPYDLNPATGAAWTAAEINAGQWGILKQT